MLQVSGKGSTGQASCSPGQWWTGDASDLPPAMPSFYPCSTCIRMPKTAWELCQVLTLVGWHAWQVPGKGGCRGEVSSGGNGGRTHHPARTLGGRLARPGVHVGTCTMQTLFNRGHMGCP